jgi:4-aminobutyrate aminotransferase-like enzyme
MSKSADLVEQVVHETLRTMPFLTFKDPDQQPAKAPDIMSAKVQRSLQHTGTVSRPALITVDEAKRLDLRRVANLFAAHLNPGQLHFMKLLGFHKVIIESAEGMYYIDREGRRILDFFGGFGSLAFGHNHPCILAVRRAF